MRHSRFCILGLCTSSALGFCVRHDGGRIVASRLTARSLDTEWSDDESTRRNFLLAASTVAAAAATSQLAPTGNSNNAVPTMSVAQAIQWIDEKCDRRFLHAVVASDYKFLYRGVDNDKIAICRDEPDLLLPGTYDSPKALNFFKYLESIMENDVIKPSNGHLATTSTRDAAQWGEPASIWPISSAHYAWFQDGGLFYPRSVEFDRHSIIVDGRDCGKDSLEDALRGDSWEVMVATKSYLAVPARMDQALREGFQQSFLV